MAAMTSSSMSGVFPPMVGTMPILPVIANIAALKDSPANTPGSNENSSSALDQAMAATLASIEVPDALPAGIIFCFSLFINKY